MKHHFTALFWVIVFLLSSGTIAQELPEVMPPSPEAASLGKFSEMPISHYTGLPNISIPITSYNVGDKSFPVSISYHARGIQVPEIASRVGTGWALNAGGQIARQVRHKADEQTDGYVNRYSLLMDELHGNGATDFFDSDTKRYQYNNSEQGYIITPNGTTINSITSTDPNTTGFRFKYDRIPDLFSLNVGNLSAKFILNYEDDQPLLQKYDDVKISYVIGNGGIASFEVIDKDGFIYKFGDGGISNWQLLNKNYVMQQNGSYVQSNATNIHDRTNNTWLLTRIESPNGDFANFIYTEEIYEQINRSYDERVDYQNPQYDFSIGIGEQLVSYGSQSYIHQYQLSEIRFNYDKTNLSNYDKIVFIGYDNRLDLKSGINGSIGPNELDEIKLFNRNTTIKTFQLYHSYKTNINDNNQNYYYKSLEPECNQRLFLDSITEVGNNVSKPPYIFEYNSQLLPNRFSNSQDLWGYYNGADNGEYLSFMDGYTTNPIRRSVDPELSLAGMLEKIQYPTGGSARFTYEHNTGVKGIEFSNIRFPKVNPPLTKNLGLSPIARANYDNVAGVYKTANLQIVSRSKVTPTVNLPFSWDGHNQNIECVGSNGGPFANCYFSVQLIPIDGNGIPQINDAWQLYSDSSEFWIEPGEYQLVVDPPNNWDPDVQANTTMGADSFFNVALFIEDQIISEGELLYAAGKRIKQIEFLDSADNVVSTKYYEYKDSFGNDSGLILSIPSFGSLVQIPGIASASGSSYIQNNSLFSEHFGAVPGGPYSTYQGNTIGYSYVKEFFGSDLENHGYVSYEFLVPKDTGDYMNYPVTPPTDNEWLRGLPKFIRSYKNDNGTYKIVKEIENAYLYGDELLSSKMNPLSLKKPIGDDVTSAEINQPLGLLYDNNNRMFRLPLINLFNDATDGASYKIYHFTGGALDTRKTIERHYDDNENLTLITETETSFDYDDHYQPASVTSVTSDGQPIMEAFSYPIDLLNSSADPNENAAIQSLVDQNRVMPIETTTFKDIDMNGTFQTTETIGKTRTVYKNWTASITEPLKIMTAKGTDTPEERISFKNYDNDGNLLEVAKTDGTNIVYIWGYDNTLPVAKIENATYAQVQPFAGSVRLASNSDDSSCTASESCTENALRTAQNNLRNGLPNAMVTTYTYDPLIGITSMTDPRGYTTYYEYDGLNRLQYVKDAEGNILSENEYNYGPQN